MVWRILISAAAGCGISFAAMAWVRQLQQQRGLEHDLPVRWVIPLLTLLGGITGGCTASLGASLYGLLLLFICTAVFLMDWFHRIIPNQTVLALLLLKLALGIPALLKMPGFPPFRLGQSLIGFAACFAVFFLPGLMGRQVGAGDIKLAAAMGFLLGINHALIAIVLMGLLVMGYCTVQQRLSFAAVLKTDIPMGPFIAAGMYAAFLAANFM